MLNRRPACLSLRTSVETGETPVQLCGPDSFQTRTYPGTDSHRFNFFRAAKIRQETVGSEQPRARAVSE